MIYANFFYHNYIIGAFKAFPEPVAIKLRRALYYTNMDVQPKEALKYYDQALRVAHEIGMDPFSDELLGVKIQVASLMEKVQQYQKAIDVLEIVRNDCLKWMDQLGSKPGNEGKRTRVLGKTVGISVKLGDLYANQYVLEPDLAEEKLIWAVETVLKEQQRRDLEGVKEGEGSWMNNEEMGGAFECEIIQGLSLPTIPLASLNLTNTDSTCTQLRRKKLALFSSSVVSPGHRLNITK